MAFIHSDLKAVIDQDLSSEQVEALWLKIETREGNIGLGVIYKPPSYSQEEDERLHNVIRRASNKHKEIIICGDFNHRSINWHTLDGNAEDQPFLNLTQDCFLVQHVKEATRKENILDLILSANEASVENVRIEDPLATSDHNIILFYIVCKTDLLPWNTEIADYKHSDYVKMRRRLNLVDWEARFHEGGVCNWWAELKSEILGAVEEFVPKKTRRKNNKPAW